MEWPRNLLERDRLDEQPGIAQVPPGAASEEAVQLGIEGTLTPLPLLLERSKGTQVAVRLEDGLDRVEPDRPNQLGLEIGLADVEADIGHIGRRAWIADPRIDDGRAEHVGAIGVTQSGELEVGAARTEPVQVASRGLGASDRNDDDGLAVEVTPQLHRNGFHGDLVTDALDDDDGFGTRDLAQRTIGGAQVCALAVGVPFEPPAGLLDAFLAGHDQRPGASGPARIRSLRGPYRRALRASVDRKQGLVS